MKALLEVKFLEDEEIIKMFFDRSEQAIKATQSKYGALCTRISLNILHSGEDAKECVNDTMYKAWETLYGNLLKCSVL